MTSIFVGNLSYQTTDSDLATAFGEFGPIERASVVRNRDSGQSRGFGFVETTSAADANRAMNALNGQDLNGRLLNVNEARPRESNGQKTGPAEKVDAPREPLVASIAHNRWPGQCRRLPLSTGGVLERTMMHYKPMGFRQDGAIRRFWFNRVQIGLPPMLVSVPADTSLARTPNSACRNFHPWFAATECE